MPGCWEALRAYDAKTTWVTPVVAVQLKGLHGKQFIGLGDQQPTWVTPTHCLLALGGSTHAKVWVRPFLRRA